MFSMMSDAGRERARPIDGAKIADPAHYYKDVVIPADMNLTF